MMKQARRSQGPAGPSRHPLRLPRRRCRCLPLNPLCRRCDCHTQVPTLVFASFLAFNVLAWFSLRMINKKGTIKHPKNLALIKAG